MIFLKNRNTKRIFICYNVIGANKSIANVFTRLYFMLKTHRFGKLNYFLFVINSYDLICIFLYC